MESLSKQANSPSWKLPLFMGIAAAVWGVAIWRPTPTGIWHDDGVYLLIAKSLANGEGLRYAGVVGTPLAAKFPPLYPLVLTPFWMFGEDLAAGSGWLAGLNVLFLAIAVAIFARILSTTFCLRPLQVGAVTLVAWVTPSLWSLTAIPLSEPLFILGSVLVLGASAEVFPKRKDEDGPTPVTTVKTWILFLGAFALTYHTRTIAIALLAAAVAGLLLRRRWRDLALMGGLGLAIMLPWMRWSANATSTIEPSLQDLLGSYGGWLVSQAVAAPALYGQQISSNLTVLGQGLVSVVIPQVAGAWLWIAGIGVGLSVIAGVRRVWPTNPLWCLYPLAYLGVLLLWPYRSGRLLAPILPIFVALVALGVLEIQAELRRQFVPRNVSSGFTAVAVILGLWMSGSGLWKTASGEFLEPYVIRARTLARTVEVIEETTLPNAIIGAPEIWAAIHLHTGRTVLPSARFRPLSTNGPPWGTPQQQYEIWHVGRVDHILVEHGGTVHGEALDKLDAACPPGTIKLLASFPGPSHFVRLDLDAPCWDDLLGS